MRHHETSSDVIATRQKHTVSESTRLPTKVNTKQDDGEPTAARIKARKGSGNSECCNRAGRRSRNCQYSKPKHRAQSLGTHNAPPVPTARMLHHQERNTRVLLGSVSKQANLETCLPTSAKSKGMLSSSRIVGQ